ncbi:hypothetical protein SASPL_150549 [Salvia splendens]|uniref:Auxin-responsive protein n=1 Tax=Salvia splendens TaxID=180675 RepID=A0A8X8W6S1_SALSN|nr:hypothetical protein SASPL_150549 [Salvia splendens]
MFVCKFRDSGCVDVEEDAVVGWPQVNSQMRKVAEHHRRESTASNYVTVDNRGGGLNSMYVKVEMEGIGIARKISLWKAETHHFVVREDVIGSQWSIALSSTIFSSA